LQAEFGFTIWFSNYVSPLTWRLARLSGAGWVQQARVRPDVRRARRLFWIYWRHGAWTWPLMHRWPGWERYFSQPAGGADMRPLAGERFIDVTRLRWWRPGSAETMLG